MPAPATVTPADISGAAATLQAAGEQITGWRLRRVLGRGRPDRLEAIWREQQAEAAPTPAPEPEAPPLPPAISEHLAAAEERALADVRGLVAAAWRLAADLAARRVADEIRDARDRVAVLEAELNEAGRAVDAADERGATLEQELAEARQAAATVEAALAQARAEAERAAASTAARLDDAAREAERLRTEIEMARQDAARAREEAAAEGRRAAAADASMGAATQAAQEAKAERDAARAEAQDARQARSSADSVAIREGTRAEAAERRAAEAERRAQVADQRLAEALAALAAPRLPAASSAADLPRRGAVIILARPVSKGSPGSTLPRHYDAGARIVCDDLTWPGCEGSHGLTSGWSLSQGSGVDDMTVFRPEEVASVEISAEQAAAIPADTLAAAPFPVRVVEVPNGAPAHGGLPR